MDIKFDINKALTELAKGLGVAVDKLYPILYKQAIIEGVYNLLSILFLVAIWIFIYRISKASIYKFKKDFKENNDGWNDNIFEHIMDKHLLTGIFGGLYCIFVIIFGVASLFMLPDLIKNTITAFFNTDYYVINDLIQKIKQ